MTGGTQVGKIMFHTSFQHWDLIIARIDVLLLGYVPPGKGQLYFLQCSRRVPDGTRRDVYHQSCRKTKYNQDQTNRLPVFDGHGEVVQVLAIQNFHSLKEINQLK